MHRLRTIAAAGALALAALTLAPATGTAAGGAPAGFAAAGSKSPVKPATDRIRVTSLEQARSLLGKPADADNPTLRVTFRSALHQDNCMGVSFGGDGQWIEHWKCYWDQSQQFDLVADPNNDLVEIKPVKSLAANECVDIKNGRYAQRWGCHLGPNQRFYLDYIPVNDTFSITPQMDGSKVLEIDDAGRKPGIQIWGWNGGLFQQWFMHPY